MGLKGFSLYHKQYSYYDIFYELYLHTALVSPWASGLQTRQLIPISNAYNNPDITNADNTRHIKCT